MKRLVILVAVVALLIALLISGHSDTTALVADTGISDNDKTSSVGEADIRLCGGILSGPPDSFRGKVYVDPILEITSEILDQEWIPPDKVKRMYEALMKCNPKEAAKGDYRYSITESEIINLRKFFKVCAERNLGLVGW